MIQSPIKCVITLCFVQIIRTSDQRWLWLFCSVFMVEQDTLYMF